MPTQIQLICLTCLRQGRGGDLGVPSREEQVHLLGGGAGLFVCTLRDNIQHWALFLWLNDTHHCVLQKLCGFVAQDYTFSSLRILITWELSRQRQGFLLINTGKSYLFCIQAEILGTVL